MVLGRANGLTALEMVGAASWAADGKPVLLRDRAALGGLRRFAGSVGQQESPITPLKCCPLF
jgi:hypothetical protein